LDRGARDRFATSVREKAGAAHPEPADEEQVVTGSTTPEDSEAEGALAETVEDGPGAESSQAAEPADVSETSEVPATAADEDLVIAESVVADEDAPAISQQQASAHQQAPGQPQPVTPAANAPEPVRFAPGTMTRRQIRELERQRQEEARRAKEPPRASQPRSANASPSAAESSHTGSADVPEQDGSQPLVGSEG